MEDSHLCLLYFSVVYVMCLAKPNEAVIFGGI